MSTTFNTTSVAFAAGPTVVSTFFSHVVTWPKRHRRSRHATSSTDSATSLNTLPGNQLRYEEGLRVVRRFLEFASNHGVEEVQGFTAQPVPIPRWVHRELVTVPEGIIIEAAGILTEHLATYANGDGLQVVGGKEWWRVRGRPLEGEWLEMRKAYDIRKARAKEAKAEKRRSWLSFDSLRYSSTHAYKIRDGSGAEVEGDRVIFYIHGGAFFFSSLDMHRYQIQRHARKAGARAFVPNYRLSPQYPFPCGLLDCLAAYMYLLDPPADAPHKAIRPSNIVFMGDSAGGGMCMSLLVVIREMGLPMPAAASLMSPWVDLTHSMPSIQEWDGGDYIPSVGFHYKPSLVWPPIPGDGIEILMEDGTKKIMPEQIQLYCPNSLLTHPLVSPINQGSLGGLCPLYINAGGAELLRDEIIYLGHKAADPSKYQPSPATLLEYPEQEAMVSKYPPTKVVLQVFEGACHVATTLAWTRSAKHIFRGAADFNIWAWKNAAKGESVDGTMRSGSAPHLTSGMKPLTAATTPSSSRQVTNMTSSNMSSTTSVPLNGAKHITFETAFTNEPDSFHHSHQSSQSSSSNATPAQSHLDMQRLRLQDTSAMSDEETDMSTDDGGKLPPNAIRIRGEAPAWGRRTIVAQRVSTHGLISPMEPDPEVPALRPELRNQVGRIRASGPLKKWLEKREEWNKKYSKEYEHFRAIRTADRQAAEKRGFLTGRLQGERVPLTALAGLSDLDLARKVGKSVDEPTTKTSMPVLLWMAAGEKADKEAVDHQEDKEEERRKSHEKERRKSHVGRRSTSSEGKRRGSIDAAFESVKGALGRVGSRKGKQ